MSVFPVGKSQFERFLAETPPRDGRWTHAWYLARLSTNPRVPVGEIERPWCHWITGLDDDEVGAFLRFLGPGHRLPREDEWRRLAQDREAWVAAVREARMDWLGSDGLARTARLWLEQGFLPVPGEGLVERVADGPDRVVGRPDPRWHPTLWAAGSTHVLTEAGRHLAGFRVLREEG